MEQVPEIVEPDELRVRAEGVLDQQRLVERLRRRQKKKTSVIASCGAISAYGSQRDSKRARFSIGLACETVTAVARPRAAARGSRHARAY